MKFRWKMPLNIHWKMPLTIHYDFGGVDFWCAIVCPCRLCLSVRSSQMRSAPHAGYYRVRSDELFEVHQKPRIHCPYQKRSHRDPHRVSRIEALDAQSPCAAVLVEGGEVPLHCSLPNSELPPGKPTGPLRLRSQLGQWACLGEVMSCCKRIA